MSSPENITYLNPPNDAAERLEREVLAARLNDLLADDARGHLAQVTDSDFTTPSFAEVWRVCDEIESHPNMRANIERVAAIMGERDLWKGKVKTEGDLGVIFSDLPGVLELPGLVRALRGSRASQELAVNASRQAALLNLLTNQRRAHEDTTDTERQINDLKEAAGQLTPLVERGPLSESLRNMTSELVEEQVSGIMAKGTLSMIVGPDGHGKTFASIALACSMITGKDFLGHMIKSTGAVYYIAAEGRASIKPRVLSWCREFGVDPEAVLDDFIITTHAASSLRLIGWADVAALTEDIKKHHKEFALIVVDTYAIAAGIDNENDNGPASQYAANMRRLSDETGATVLTVHHPSKDNWLNPRGASSLRAAQDTVIALRQDENKTTGKVQVDKYRHGQRGELIRTNLNEGHYIGENADRPTPVMVATAGGSKMTDDDLIDAIRNVGGGSMTKGVAVADVLVEIAETYGANRGEFNRARRRLIDRGVLDKSAPNRVVKIVEPVAGPDATLDL